MADVILDKLISETAKKELETLISGLREASSIANKIVVNTSNAKTVKELADAQLQYNKAIHEEEANKLKIQALNQKIATDAQKELDRQNAIKEKAHNAELKRLEAEARAQAKLTAEAEKQVAVKNKNRTTFKDATPGSINQLSSANAILTERLKGLNQATADGASKADRLRGAIDRNQKKITEMGTVADKQRANIGNYGSAFDGVKSKIMGLVAGLGLLNIARMGVSKIVDTTAMFEKFSAVLTNTLGSKDKAAKAMDDLTKWASETPFEVDKATESYVKLANAGFIPTMEEMTKLGDLASSRGKDLDQLTEAILDASSGEFERLKEFGIKASKSGDQVAFSFKGIKTTVANTDAEIRKYVLSLGAMNGVQGTMSAVSATLGGKISNMKDSFTSLFKSMGERGNSVLSGAVDAFTNITKAVTKFVSVPVSETMEKERIKVNQLTGVLRSNANPQAVRVKAYEELQKIAPSVVAGIDKENVNTIALNQNLKNYNQLTIQKIALKAKEETLRTVEENAAKRLQENFEATLSFDKAMEKLYNKISSKSTVAQMAELSKNMRLVKKDYEDNKITAIQYFEELEKWGNKFGAIGMSDVTDLKYTKAPWLVGTKGRYEQAQDEATKAMDEFDKFQSDLEARFGKVNISPTSTPTPTPTPSGGNGKASGGKGKAKTQKEIDEDKLASMLKLLKEQEDFNKQITENETKSLMERSIAYDEYTKLRIKQIELQNKFDNKYSASDKTANDLKMTNESNKIMLDAEKWYYSESDKQTQKAEKDREEKEKETHDEMFNLAIRTNEELLLDNKITTDKLNEQNARRFIDGLVTQEEYEKNKERIAEESAKQILRIELKLAEDQLEVLNKAQTWNEEDSKKAIDLEQQISDVKLKLLQVDTDKSKEAHDKKMTQLDEYADKTKQIMGAVMDVYTAFSDRKKADIESEMALNNEAQQAELTAIEKRYNTSTKAKTKEEVEKDKVNEKYAKKQKKLEYDKAVIDRNIAKWKKVSAVAEATIQTALGIVDAKGNPLKIALVTALGASSIATIMSQKLPELPKFKTGTNFHKGGFATVGDGGRELLEMPTGEHFLATDEITANFPRGMKVLNNKETERVLHEAKNYTAQVVDLSELTKEQTKTNKFLKEIAQKQTINRIFVDVNSKHDQLRWR